MKTFISPNQGQTALTLQHTSGYKVPPGHNQDGYTNGGDRVNLRLNPEDEKLIDVVSKFNENVVVVYVGGSAIDMSPWEDKVNAILFSWYSGMEGGNSLARVLYGDVNPSGKLPFTIAKNQSDYPYFNPYTDSIKYEYYHLCQVQC